MQYSSYFENSCKVILEKLCVFSGAEACCVSVITDDVLTSYEYAAGTDKLFSFQNRIADSRRSYSGVAERVKRYGMAWKDSSMETPGCSVDFDKIIWKNSLVYGIKLDGKIIGHLILCSNADDFVWSDDTLGAVCDFSQIVAGLLQSKKTQDELEGTNQTFKTVLDNIDSYVFALDNTSGKIIFSNEKLDSLFGESACGKTLGELFGSEFLALEEGDFGMENRSFDYLFEKTDQWFDVSVATVSWVSGKPVRLVTLNDISDKIEYERLIERQALYDQLTGLPNRRKLEHDFYGYIAHTKEENKKSYVLFVDLDDFKNLNDTRGHNYGDMHLKNVAAYLKSFEAWGVMPYRFGGDEFVLIVLPESKYDIKDFQKTIMDGFNREWKLGGVGYYCTASVGVADFSGEEDSYSEVMKRVDMAVFRAKKLGKNKCVTYHKGIGDDMFRHVEIERCMRKDIKNDFRNFEVYYQPIINSNTQCLEGCEALLRWKCQTLGSVSPGEFIPVAEANGFITELGEFVLRSAAVQLKKWIDKGYRIRVNVNLSIGQLNQPEFPEKVRQIISETDVPYNSLMLEVTESMAMNDINRMREILNDFDQLGINIALDDFGTGYSSLNCLKEMPLSTIKIDKTFIDDIVDNPSTAMFVRSIVNLSHDLEMRVCAEGVEEKEQFELLKELKTDNIQGFYFGRPITSNEFEEKFLARA